MKRGAKNQLVGRAGEYLVVAELNRRGITATPLAGNAPDIDILAHAGGESIALQVKTNASGDWHTNVDLFMDIEQAGKKQKILGKKSIRRKSLHVYVKLGECRDEDEFYVLTAGNLQDMIYDGYKSYMESIGCVRKRNPESRHSAISRSALLKYRDNWEIVDKALGLKPD